MNVAMRRLAIAALGALSLASAAVSSSTEARAQADQVIHVGVSSFEAHAGAYYAQDNGFFKDVGLSVQIQSLSAGLIPGAVASGVLQIGVQNPLAIATAHEKGIDLVIIAPGTLYDAASNPRDLVVATDSAIRTGKDLEGKTVALTTLQGPNRIGVLSWIDRTGGDSQKVKLIELPQQAMANAVASGRVAAATMADPALSTAVNAGQVRGLTASMQFVGNHFFTSAWFAKRSWADDNADAVRRFRIAINRGGEWATRHPEAAARILDEYLKMTVQRSHEIHAKTIAPSMIQPIIDGAVKYKLLDSPLDARDIIWTEPARK